jgi:NTP pyrophosphatase (non-canonical NTP hydrolase)
MRDIGRIEKWAHERNLIEGSTRQAQLCKLMEEVGELATAINKQRPADVVDAIGDCAVVLTILAAQSQTTLEACIDKAYYTIKDRKGRMIDGIFVREE